MAAAPVVPPGELPMPLYGGPPVAMLPAYGIPPHVEKRNVRWWLVAIPIALVLAAIGAYVAIK